MGRRLSLLLALVPLFALAPFLLVCSTPTSQQNQPPKVEKILVDPANPVVRDEVHITCIATDPDGDSLTYDWSSTAGYFDRGTGRIALWNAPPGGGDYVVSVTVNDGRHTVAGQVEIRVTYPPSEPHDPYPPNGARDVERRPTLRWKCSDPDGEPLVYDVYLGGALIVVGHPSPSYQPGELRAGEGYLWHVVARDPLGHETSSREWSFTIRP